MHRKFCFELRVGVEVGDTLEGRLPLEHHARRANAGLLVCRLRAEDEVARVGKLGEGLKWNHGCISTH